MLAQFVQRFVGNNLKSACPAARRQFATREMICHDESLARETAIPIFFTRIAKVESRRVDPDRHERRSRPVEKVRPPRNDRDRRVGSRPCFS